MLHQLRYGRLALALLLANLAAASAFIVTACSDDDTGTTPPPGTNTADAQPEASPPVTVTDDKESKHSGKIIVAQSEDEGVPGATITAGTKTAVTGATGEYELLVPRNTPYSWSVAAPGYYTLLEQEVIVKTPTHVRGKTNLLKTETADLLAGLLPGRNKEKGFLVVKVNPRPPCETEEGSTLTIEPAGEAKVSYFAGPLPSSSQTSVKGGTSFSAAFYNIEPNVPVSVIVNSPKCKQVAFPIETAIDDPANLVTYTGKQTTQPGEALAYIRVYIQEPIVGDAGTD